MRPTVLIVDDHAAFRASARALLQAEGFDVIGEAADGAAAVEAVAALRPEIVLLDIQLPDLDGLAVAEQLAGAPDPPAVVLISSRDAAAYGPRLQATPARGFIPKSGLSGEALAALVWLRAMVRRLGLVGLAGVALGLTAEWVGFGWGDPRHWIPDLAVGWTFIGCGLVASGAAAGEPHRSAAGGDRLHLVCGELRPGGCGGGGLAGGAPGVPVSRAPGAAGAHLPVRAAGVAACPWSRRGRLRGGGHHADLGQRGRHDRAGRAAARCLRARVCSGGWRGPTGPADRAAGRCRAEPGACRNRSGSAAAAPQERSAVRRCSS